MPWKKIATKRVKDVWVCPTCKDQVTVHPDFYTDNGTPMCADCDEDMTFLHTKIYMPDVFDRRPINKS